MRLVHEPVEGDRQVLATDVETADTLLARTKGLMGRSSVPVDYALVFDLQPDPVKAALARLPGLDGFVDPDQQAVHMLFVRTPLDVVWIEDEEVVQVRTLSPWTGTGSGRGDTLVELAAGVADGVEPGDRLRVVEDVPGEEDGDSPPVAEAGD